MTTLLEHDVGSNAARPRERRVPVAVPTRGMSAPAFRYAPPADSFEATRPRTEAGPRVPGGPVGNAAS